MSASILITREVYAGLKANRAKGVIIKLDFSKAFDTVDWRFLYQVLEHINFGQTWIVDGAWGITEYHKAMGGIGGTIKKRSRNSIGKLVHSFSGPVEVNSSTEAEIEALLHVIRIVISKSLTTSRIVICSDSREALKVVRTGLQYFSPISGPIPNLKSENGMEDGTMKCPCKHCKNLNWLKIDDVRFHLLAKGMLEGYTVWTSHGEKIERKRSRTSHHRYCVREPSRVEEPVELNVMLHDLAGENYQFYEITVTGTMNVEEAPNDSAKKLYEVIVENGAPIYPGN
ncbi:hypothetical protein AgCh_031628 [Apium graveolens]